MAKLEHFDNIDDIESLNSDIQNLKEKIRTEKILTIYSKLSENKVWQTTGNTPFLNELKNLIEVDYKNLKEQMDTYHTVGLEIKNYKEKEQQVEDLETKIDKEERKEKSSSSKIKRWNREKKQLLTEMKDIVLSVESKLS